MGAMISNLAFVFRNICLSVSVVPFNSHTICNCCGGTTDVGSWFAKKPCLRSDPSSYDDTNSFSEPLPVETSQLDIKVFNLAGSYFKGRAHVLVEG